MKTQSGSGLGGMHQQQQTMMKAAAWADCGAIKAKMEHLTFIDTAINLSCRSHTCTWLAAQVKCIYRLACKRETTSRRINRNKNK